MALTTSLPIVSNTARTAATSSSPLFDRSERRDLDFEALGEIDLARLIEDQKPGHRMVRLLEKEALKGQRHGHVVSEPVGAASNFPEIVGAIGLDDANC